jgi:hypothetical protein
MVNELCTVEDVILEGVLISNKDLDDKIEYKIENVSQHIHQITNKDISKGDASFSARMACVYGVLAWLESKNMIASSKEITSLHEGGVSINYNPNQTNHANTQSLSYTSLYQHYMNRLVGTAPIGSRKNIG